VRTSASGSLSSLINPGNKSVSATWVPIQVHNYTLRTTRGSHSWVSKGSTLGKCMNDYWVCIKPPQSNVRPCNELAKTCQRLLIEWLEEQVVCSLLERV
jgi:hypothetical protein